MHPRSLLEPLTSSWLEHELPSLYQTPAAFQTPSPLFPAHSPAHTPTPIQPIVFLVAEPIKSALCQVRLHPGDRDRQRH